MILQALFALCSADVVINPDLGIDSVKQYAGSFNVTHGSTFFYMFESRSNPCEDPVIFWFNGGPGASSMPAILFENGPSTIQGDGSLKNNPYSWNEFANVVYIDNPVGTGFSQPYDPDLYQSTDAAVDFVDFVNEFYKYFPGLIDSDLHIAGESYAGVYVPIFAEALAKAGTKKISSIMLGDAQVDYGEVVLSLADFYCGKDNVGTLLPNDTCAAMFSGYDQCKLAVKSCDAAAITGDYDGCNIVMDKCSGEFQAPSVFNKKGGNPYNVKAECEPTNGNLCYSIIETAGDFFNQSSVKEKLGFSASFDFKPSSRDIFDNWENREGFGGLPTYVESLLGQGVRVLVYNGDLDAIIPFESARTWTGNLNWSGSAGFKSSLESPQPWTVNGASSGEISTSGELTLLKIFNAGHMVPYDQPAAAQAMAKAWVSS